MANLHDVKRRIQAYLSAMALTYGVESTKEFFAITSPIDTQLRDALMHSVQFLGQINMQHVDQIAGQVVVTGTPGIYTGRSSTGRFNRELGNSGNTYELNEMDSGSYLPYKTLVAWSNAGSDQEFINRIQAFSNKSFALDILRIGFNGLRADPDTDPVANPLGEDVAPGWHKIVEDRSPIQIVKDPITLDRSAPPTSGGNYVSLDAIVTDIKMNLIIDSERENPDLVALIGADLIGADATSLMNRIDRPTEKVAAQLINREVGGLKAYSPPYFKPGCVTVTSLWNLHHYVQQGTEMRKAEWVDDRKRFENNYLRMAGYAVEYDELYGSFDNITAVA
ncbi:TPA: phage major capsid protein, P2 family [Klebsiella oxytoca]|nr:phage major capsid protein, P2 family [Klebsiella oxytoca]